MIKTKSVKTRFAPSPTGFMHLGSIKAVLFPYFLAKANNGKFLLRIDDTDRERSSSVYEEDIVNNLKWLNVVWDESFKQSNRKIRYNEIFELLKENNLIYKCYETQDELASIKQQKTLKKKAPIITKNDCTINDSTREEYWRFDITQNNFVFNDIIQGKMEFTKTWSDPVIRKPNKDYTYIFSSVIDDIDYEISHIIRGEEHISNGVIQQAIGDVICKLLFNKNWDIAFAHFPLFLNAEGQKLSKRNLFDNFSDLKYLEPETFYSFVYNSGLSSNHIFSTNVDEYFKEFKLEKYNNTKQTFNLEILNNINKKILSKKPCPSTEDQYIWDLLIHNSENINHFHKLQNNLKNFITNIDQYINIKNLIIEKIDFNEFIKLENKNKNDCYFLIYQTILQENFGPKINILFDYIKKIIPKI